MRGVTSRLIANFTGTDLLFCVRASKCTMTQRYIIKTDRYGGAWIVLELPNLHSPCSVPLASSAVLSLSLCALHAATLPVSQWMSPRPLPVCFIKPVRDEVKSWRQLFRLVSIFSSRSTPQAAGWSTVRCSLMTNNQSLLLILYRWSVVFYAPLFDISAHIQQLYRAVEPLWCQNTWQLPSNQLLRSFNWRWYFCLQPQSVHYVQYSSFHLRHFDFS